MPLTTINILLRLNFLLFLNGCNLHGMTMLPKATAAIEMKSVVKCFGMPYFDRAVLEFIHYIPVEKPSFDEDGEIDEIRGY